MGTKGDCLEAGLERNCAYAGLEVHRAPENAMAVLTGRADWMEDFTGKMLEHTERITEKSKKIKQVKKILCK